jgi:tetratricopeptide (TPR) repeat protein/tRNA A-37 threonylcarbamoyl transferase component Bud32
VAEDPRAYLNLRLKGRYLIEEHLGSGLSAHAFKAFDTLLQGKVVVKIVKTELAGLPIDVGESWKEECRKAMQVRGHPHIASILDLGEETVLVGDQEEKTYFIVTEYVSGRTLREIDSSPNPIPASELLAIAYQLLGTLDYLQARKLSHDDLHAGNVMVTYLGASKPFIKIIDFGLATNTLVPRSKEKDVHFALSELEHLCQKALASPSDPLTRSVLESLSSLIRKGKSFLSTGRMRLADMVTELEVLQQDLSSRQVCTKKAPVENLGPRQRIEVQRRTPFAGRRNEVRQVHRIVTGAFLAKIGAVVLISGEAGIGKTRLVDETVGYLVAERTRHILLYHKCVRQAVNLPLGPVFEAIINFLEDVPGDNDLDRLGVLLGPSHSLVKPLARLINNRRSTLSGQGSEVGDSSELVGAPYLLAGFLMEASISTPVILFLDDIHLADPTTIEFIGLLFQRITESPITIFATFRPEEIQSNAGWNADSLQNLLGDLSRTNYCTHVELRGLERAEMDEILSNLYTFLHPKDFSDLSDQVHQMAGGNPLFLLEITGLMEDEGYLVCRADNRWALDGYFSRFSVPGSINSLIERRIAELTSNETLLLRAAAIQGQTFDIAILERMFAPIDERLLDVLGSLIKGQVLTRMREAGQYSFTHQQMHRAILAGTPAEDVEQGHHKVAMLLEKIAIENEAKVPYHLIGHHLMQASRPKEAAEAYLTAGRLALASHQYQVALDHLSHALAMVPPARNPDQLTLEIVLELLESVKPLGERIIHERAVRDLQVLAENLGVPGLKLKAMLEECIYLRAINEHEHSLSVAEEVFRLASEEENNPISAVALKEAGTACYIMGRMDQAEEYFQQAAGILAVLGDHVQLARVYNNLGLVCKATDRQDEMIRYFRQSLEICRGVGDKAGERLPLGNLGIMHFERGEYEQAYESYSALKESLAGRVDPAMEARVDHSIAEILLEVGLLEEAKESCEYALSGFMGVGNTQGESDVLGTLGRIHLAMGDTQLAREYSERCAEAERQSGNMLGMLRSQATLARIANMEGNYSNAVKVAGETLKEARERRLRSIELECLTEIMQARAQMEGASRIFEVLGPEEDPDCLDPSSSPATISFAYKAGELSLQAGDVNRAIRYIAVSEKGLEKTLTHIENPEWRAAYQKKREKILDMYHRLQSKQADR